MKISGILFCIVILAFLLPFWQKTYDLGPLSGLLDTTKLVPESLSGFQALGHTWLVLLIAIIGAIVSFALPRKYYIVPIILAILGFIVLLLTKGTFKSPLDNSLAQLGDIGIKIGRQFGYYLALLGFLITAIVAFFGGRQNVLTKEQISNFIPDKMENAFDKAKSTVTAAGASVLDKVDNVYDKAKEKIDNANLDDKFDNIVDKVKDKIDKANLDEKFDQIASKVDNAYDKAKEKIDETVDKVKDYVDNDDSKKG